MRSHDNNLREFLVRAKRQTYAGDGAHAAPSRPGSRDLHYHEDDLLYIDSYLGSSDFIGEEAVWKGGEPIWAMNYYGQMLIDTVPEGFIAFLKDALRNVTVDGPFRGPQHHETDKYTYQCSWDGDLDLFEGAEYIFLDGEMIYQLRFHGGRLR